MGTAHLGGGKGALAAMTPGTCLVRVLAILAIGCFAIAHGSTEQEVFDLGETGDVGAEAKEKQIEMDVQQEDPSLAQYDIDAADQEDRIGGSVTEFESADDEPTHRRHKRRSHADSMRDELRAIQGADSELGESAKGTPEAVDQQSKDQTDATQEDKKLQNEGTKAMQVTDKEKLAAEATAQKKAAEDKQRQENELAAAKAKQERAEKAEQAKREKDEEKSEKVKETQAKAEAKSARIEKDEKVQQQKAEKKAKQDSNLEGKDKMSEKTRKLE